MKRSLSRWTAALAALGVLVVTSPVFAHTGHDHSSFAGGFLHAILGLDHLLAMVAVGFLAARLQTRQMWQLPASFVALMACGGVLGLVWSADGGNAVEWGIALSVVVFGLVIAIAPSVNPIAGAVLVGIFAVCHGHAHVAEMGSASAIGYFPGMLTATALLHLGGLGAGYALRNGVGEWSIRAAGALVAVVFAGVTVAGLLQGVVR